MDESKVGQLEAELADLRKQKALAENTIEKLKAKIRKVSARLEKAQES